MVAEKKKFIENILSSKKSRNLIRFFIFSLVALTTIIYGLLLFVMVSNQINDPTFSFALTVFLIALSHYLLSLSGKSKKSYENLYLNFSKIVLLLSMFFFLSGIISSSTKWLPKLGLSEKSISNMIMANNVGIFVFSIVFVILMVLLVYFITEEEGIKK